MTAGKIIAAIAGISVLCAMSILLIVRFSSGPEGFWVCDGGLWQPHGRPKNQKPSEPCAVTNFERTEDILINILTDEIKLDLKSGIISGVGTDRSGATNTWTVNISSTTKVHRDISSSSKEYFSADELSNVLKNWEGPKWPIWIKGSSKGAGTLEAKEVYYTIQ